MAAATLAIVMLRTPNSVRERKQNRKDHAYMALKKMRSETSEVIYDIGANNGSNLSYYLKKSDRVVAVEANSILCQKIEDEFKSYVLDGRLSIENCVISADGDGRLVQFFIHK